MATSTRRATVSATEEVIPGVIQLTLALHDADFVFAAGQSLTLHLGELRRAYSIASAPQRPLAIQLGIRLGDGPGSAAVRNLRQGDAVELSGPAGEFTVPASRDALVLIAGDTGITAVRSIVLDLAAVGDRRPITVFYEPEGDELYPGDFRPMADAGTITYQTGRIGDLLTANRKALSGAFVMVAGYQPFLMRAEEALTAAGVSPEKTRFETFGRL